ncbi:WD40 repeat domain-containing protein [Kitasatospora purpeofusca]|uniref:WD40 repeat domain-containing protein n=1 Tax=Kitasatospora purpeofusca TaxID=67352 RepID=UPI0036D0924B
MTHSPRSSTAVSPTTPNGTRRSQRTRGSSPTSGSATSGPCPTSPALPLRALTSHTGAVSAVAISPDGTWLATGRHDRTVRLWDHATGAQATIRVYHHGWVFSVAIVVDGTWLATAGGDRAVRISDHAAGTQTAVLTGHTDWVRAVAISPDGTWLATGGHDGTVRIWNTISRAPVAMMRTESKIASCSWSSDSLSLAVGSDGGLHYFRFHPGS